MLGKRLKSPLGVNIAFVSMNDIAFVSISLMKQEMLTMVPLVVVCVKLS